MVEVAGVEPACSEVSTIASTEIVRFLILEIRREWTRYGFPRNLLSTAYVRLPDANYARWLTPHSLSEHPGCDEADLSSHKLALRSELDDFIFAI